MKYYSDESRAVELPRCTAYGYLRRENEGKLDQVAINYYGAKIIFQGLFERIDRTPSAFAALGVKSGDRVSFLSVSTPESIACIYALNKLGAAANTIDPRLDVESIQRMIVGSGSKVLVAVDAARPKIARILDAIDQSFVVIQSPAASLPPVKRLASGLTSRVKVPYSAKVIRWDTFIATADGVIAQEAPYEGDRVASISYTGDHQPVQRGNARQRRGERRCLQLQACRPDPHRV